MFEWMTGTVVGKFITTFFISMVPIVELRFGLPYGIAHGLDYPLALTAAVLGNMVPVPFIIIWIESIFVWLRKHFPRLDHFIARLENRANTKGETVRRVGPIGLLLFVAIPVPGTGAWTGALIAAILHMKPRTAAPCIMLGVLIAAVIMTVLTFGVIHVVS